MRSGGWAALGTVVVAVLVCFSAREVRAEEAAIDPVLGRMSALAGARGMQAVRSFAERHDLRVRASGKVAVVLELAPGRHSSSLDRALLRGWDADEDGAIAGAMRVWVRPERIGLLARLPGVARVRPPVRAIPDTGLGATVSEGVGLVGAEDLQLGGMSGAGVKVGVVDTDFEDLAAAQANGELPAATTFDYTFTGMETGDDHGTGVAEIVMDMAPGAQLYLFKIQDDIDLALAVADIHANGLDVVNMSLGFPTLSYYDNGGPVSALINDSHDNHDVFWAVSSGNYARGHWRGLWDDVDADNLLEFAAGDERLELTTSSSQACIYLNWDQYSGIISVNLDLYVYRSSGVLEASSTGFHFGGLPREWVCFTYNSDPLHAPYEVEVRKASGVATGLDISLFSIFNEIEHKVLSASMLDPAPADGAFSVAAVRASIWDSAPVIESFSSQGPTTDGRQKPEITGPDRVATWSRGSGTSGTSFAAPHVAGAAALQLEQDPAQSVVDLENFLRGAATDLGAAGWDPVFGVGQLVSPLLVGGLFDTDADAVANLLDNCEHTANVDQSDLGMLGGSGMDGIGDVCQCGDAGGGGAVTVVDELWLGSWLAGLTGPLPVPELCNVRGPADGGVSDCDIVDLAVLKRALQGAGPGVSQVCSPALPAP